jgi:hypothetical protein
VSHVSTRLQVSPRRSATLFLFVCAINFGAQRYWWLSPDFFLITDRKGEAVMLRVSLFLAAVLCLPAVAMAQTKESIVPAGTLIQCTLNEPRLSSKTAQVGDPVLCHIDSLAMLRWPVFPRGAYLSGRFVEFRDPGHFFGKGWLKLEFDTLTLRGGSFPVSAKIISAPKHKVDATGKIHGRGHARRDAVGWAIPILWPEKLVTLPMRGPRPTLKGETRIVLKLLEDVSIPPSSTVNSSDARSLPLPPSSLNSNFKLRPFPRIRYGGTSIPAVEAEPPLPLLSTAAENAILDDRDRRSEKSRPTLLILKNGDARLATNYWFEVDQIVYVDNNGIQQTIRLEDLDLRTSIQINWERHLPFALRSKTREP